MAEIRSKPFPWRCGRCRKRSVNPATVSYSTDVEHDGRTYTVTVPDLEVLRCDTCGEMILGDAANRRISETFRRQVGLLPPEQIRAHREALGLTQKQLANSLGIAEATLSRWETGGQIQQRSLDRLLRLFFAVPEARFALSNGAGMANVAAPAGLENRREVDRAARLSRLAQALDYLPEEKEGPVMDELHRLVELMRGR